MIRDTHLLSSGIAVRQDFRTSVRAILFDTGDPDWKYATHGGTAFIVNVRGRPFGLTCRHVFKDFNWRQLVLTESRFGRKIARTNSLLYPSRPVDDSIDSDILDLAIIKFADDVGATFFDDPPYIVDANTVGVSECGDRLFVNGTLKEKSDFGEASIATVFALLEFGDQGASAVDPSLREACAKFDKPEFGSVAGLSGSPVYNLTKNKLCGMAVRGSLTDGICRLWYIDIFDIMKFIEAMVDGKLETYYDKTTVRVLKTEGPTTL